MITFQAGFYLACCSSRLTMWKALRSRFFVQMKDVRPPPLQPFGSDFGFTLFPEFVAPSETTQLTRCILNSNLLGTPARSDGRNQLPPIPFEVFAPIVDRLEAERIVFPNYLNNQTVNQFGEGDFIRAHVDNLFYYDETFAIISLGAPCLLRFVHLQNGESLEFVVPDRSVYILEGASRYTYMHMVLPVEYQRFSVVLRRGILRTAGHFGSPELNLPAATKSMLGFQAAEVLDALMSKQIGVPRITCDEQWMEREGLGPFDTAEMVTRLRPLQHWSLQSQLREDEARYDELVRRRYISEDQLCGGQGLKWRFAELATKFSEVEAELDAKREVLKEAATKNRRDVAAARD